MSNFANLLNVVGGFEIPKQMAKSLHREEPPSLALRSMPMSDDAIKKLTDAVVAAPAMALTTTLLTGTLTLLIAACPA